MLKISSWSNVKITSLVLAVLFSLFITSNSFASFDKWVDDFWPSARKAGIKRSLYVAAFRDVKPDPVVLEKARRQPEFTKKMWEYLHQTVTQERIVEGRALLKTHRKLLAKLEQRYGVSKNIIVAIWGLESNYGKSLENPKLVRPVIRSLATLAYKGGRRSRFGRQQLIAALKIVQRGDIALAGMSGSWAGAMGHTQFIPTTYNAYAVDYDGDGRRDIWNSVPDALASTANYLRKAGWQPLKTWGYEVRVPKNVISKRSGKKHRAALATWSQKRGAKRVSGRAFPRPADRATLLAPASSRGPQFLMLKNFFVIKRYNNADAYALAVGHLADRLGGGKAFVQKWPWAYEPLTASEVIELQERLNAKGFAAGKPDGKVGEMTLAAIKSFSKSRGLKVAIYASKDVLRALRQ